MLDALPVLRAHADSRKLAADLCPHYDPRYGHGLNGPGRTEVMEIVRLMFNRIVQQSFIAGRVFIMRLGKSQVRGWNST